MYLNFYIKDNMEHLDEINEKIIINKACRAPTGSYDLFFELNNVLAMD